MRIVHQSVSFSYSQPPNVLLLASPSIAGLLPARTPIRTQVEIVRHQSWQMQADRQADSPRVYRSFAEWRAADEELRQHFERSNPYIRDIYRRVYGETSHV